MGYKMKGFSGFGNSPVKQKGDMPKDFNVKGSSSSTTPKYKGPTSTLLSGEKIPWDPTKRQVIKPSKKVKGPTSTLASGKKIPWDPTKRQVFEPSKKAASKVSKTKTILATNLKSAGKQFAKKVGKFLGGKALGVAGMMMATSSKADQPKNKKSEGQQIKDLLTKHKLKGGNN
tara:strand:- start:10 stop:528 length:519 start_codon:yes stop_codon:yes gene_type:complete